MGVTLRLNFRSLLLVKGGGCQNFLQGLITKDMDALNHSRLIYAFLLNVKGRIFADIFIWKLSESKETDVAFVLETDSSRMDALQKVLRTYRLRKPIQIEPFYGKEVHFQGMESEQITSNKCSSNGWLEDPRVFGFGCRSLQATNPNGGDNNNHLAGEEARLAYLQHRLHWGIAEGTEMQSQIPLNMNGDLMNAISFEKGCYIGQELVARTYHTGVIRRRVMPFRWVDPTIAPHELRPSSSPETAGEDVLMLRDEKGRRQGKLICSSGEGGLCLASVQAVPPNGNATMIDAKGRALEVQRPEWWPKTDQQGNLETT